MLKDMLKERGVENIRCCDLARSDISEVVAQAFYYSKLVLASTTYNGGIFPAMREFINCLTEREYQNRVLAFIENGSWASTVGKLMKERFENSKDITFMEPFVRILSTLNEENRRQLEILSIELSK